VEETGYRRSSGPFQGTQRAVNPRAGGLPVRNRPARCGDVRFRQHRARSVERPFRLPRRRPCRRSSGNAGRNTGMAGETPAPRHVG
jgi:hypothetical protein